MRFEQFVIDKWEGWDGFGSDYYFYECVLNPSFWAGREIDLQEIYKHQEIQNELPTVYFGFDDAGFIIQVYFNSDEIPVWTYNGIISRGSAIEG